MGISFLIGGILLIIAYLIGTTSIVLTLGVIGLLLGIIFLVSAGLQSARLKKREIRK
jgi:VIT1/CCC1 family predicted Fe2+/Mn2+ transporter